MDDKTRRNTGGAPPKVHEEVLRSQYGEPGVTLIRLLYRMRTEGRFTNKDAARRWVDSDPDSSAGIVSRQNEDGPVIIDNRLSELMAMKNGRVPRGLVQAFLDLWAANAGRSSADIQALADEINTTYKAVSQEPQTTLSSSGRRTTKDAEIVRLKDELLSVQHQLVEATQNEHRFRNLAFVLVIALNQLQQQHDHLIRERDELLDRADATELANQDAQTSGEQVIRARAQLSETDNRLSEATALVKELQHQYAHLLAQLTGLGSPATPAAPADSSSAVPALHGWTSAPWRNTSASSTASTRNYRKGNGGWSRPAAKQRLITPRPTPMSPSSSTARFSTPTRSLRRTSLPGTSVLQERRTPSPGTQIPRLLGESF